MENFVAICEALAVVVATLGGIRQYILKPYFDHREDERKWKEQLEKMKEGREEEREKRRSERDKRLGDKYEQLGDSITILSEMVKEIKNEQQQMLVGEARFDERFQSIEARVDLLQNQVQNQIGG